MKKALSCVLVVCVIAIWLSSRAFALPVEEMKELTDEFTQLVQRTNAERQFQLAAYVRADVRAYTANFAEENGYFSEEEIALYTTPHSRDMLSQSEAQQDIEAAFDMFRMCYGGYLYFGGDAVFGEAKRQAQEAVAALGDALTAPQLASILAECLSFVQDGHFSVGSIPVAESKTMYYVPELHPEKDSGGYTLTMSDGMWRVVSINGQEPDPYIQPTVAADGRLVYGFFQLASRMSDAQELSDLVLERNGYTRVMRLTWESGYWNMTGGQEVYASSSLQGMPVHSLHYMGEDTAEGVQGLNDFVVSGKACSQEPYFVLDLRGNRGGTQNYAFQWFTSFTGAEPQFPYTRADKFTELSTEAARATYPYREVSLPDTVMEMSARGEWYVTGSEAHWLENDTLIFVLMDKGVGSTGETLLRYLHTLENVVFVGSNSYGGTLVTSNTSKYLPNSGVELYFGQGLMLAGNGDNIDGVGFMPDIWVHPSQALGAVIALSQYYNIQDWQTT